MDGYFVCRSFHWGHIQSFDFWWLVFRSCKAVLAFITQEVPSQSVGWYLDTVPPPNTMTSIINELRCESFMRTQLSTQWSWMRCLSGVCVMLGAKLKRMCRLSIFRLHRNTKKEIPADYSSNALMKRNDSKTSVYLLQKHETMDDRSFYRTHRCRCGFQYSLLFSGSS